MRSRRHAGADLAPRCPAGRSALLSLPCSEKPGCGLACRAGDPRGDRVIAAHPEAGRPAAKMDPEFREWLIAFGGSGYLVLYRLDGDQAVVLAVRHHREAGYG